jgi:predicted nucleic acid-binding protein
VATLIDSNVLLDVLQEDEEWIDWSASAVARAAERGPVVVNPIIYAEVAAGYDTIEALDAALPSAYYGREPLPWAAGFLVSRVYLSYRRRGGSRATPLPFFYIGAHAAVAGHTLLTRDPRRYRTYFPTLRIIAP